MLEKSNNQYRNFKQIVNTFYNEEIEEIEEKDKNLKNKGSLQIESKIIYDKFAGDMKVEFKIGDKKMYRIKDLSEFYTRMLEKRFYKYGEKLQFVHTREMFTDESQPLLEFILKYAEVIKYANSNSNSNYKYYGKALSETSILLGNTGVDELFDILKEKKVNMQKDCKIEEVLFTEEQPQIEFTLKKLDGEQYSITPNIEIFNVTIIKGKNYKYILNDKKMYRCTKEFENTNLKLLELFRQNYMTEVLFGKEELSSLFSIVMPKVKNAIVIENMEEDEIAKYKPEELETKIYLDFNDKDYLIAEIKFIYGDKEFNPLDEKIRPNFPRNLVKETRALNCFHKSRIYV